LISPAQNQHKRNIAEQIIADGTAHSSQHMTSWTNSFQESVETCPTLNLSHMVSSDDLLCSNRNRCELRGDPWDARASPDLPASGDAIPGDMTCEAQCLWNIANGIKTHF
jgi:hypothetical protein